MKNIIIAIDGPAGSGKTATGISLSKLLNYQFIDTGLTYRAFTWFCIKNNINFNNFSNVLDCLNKFNYEINNDVITINNFKKNVSDSDFYDDNVLNNISKITNIVEVRNKMVLIQRKLCKTNRGVVVIGRDITSVVLPNADLKIYLTANLEARSLRRFKQNQNLQINDSVESVYQKIKERDNLDKTRSNSPLKIVEDAWIIDNSNLSLNETVDMIYERVKKIIFSKNNMEERGE